MENFKEALDIIRNRQGQFPSFPAVPAHTQGCYKESMNQEMRKRCGQTQSIRSAWEQLKSVNIACYFH